ncbi:penicillin-insensitive murein endopeptidase, partial [Klebsiella pneumoniae]|uniref:penicillin-insensitive murein endopeptidase n=1 Tax=Klebsiella pneumoniae TaxID=573 RepID=UPI003F864A64
ALPLSAPGYQVMRTDQRRYFGHPDLVQFIQRLSNQVHNKGMGTVLIGDMGMPAGGRFNGGGAPPPPGPPPPPPRRGGGGPAPPPS